VAKKRKVLVDVIVDDKGTTKKMAVDQRQLKGAMDQTSKSTRDTRKNIRGAAQTASAGGKQFAALSAGTGGLVAAYATLAAQIFAVSAAFNFLKQAGSLKQLQEGQLAYTAAVGTSMKSLTQDIQKATESQLSFQEAAQAGAIATAAGLSPETITKLGKAAADASAILGRDLTDSFNRLVRGVTKAEPELLDELGIILRLKDATEAYKTSLGITGELSAFQRSQAVANDVLEQAEMKYGAIREVVAISSNDFQKLGVAFDDIVNSIKDFAVKFLTPIALMLQEFPALIVAAFAPFTVSVLRGALPGLTNLQSSLNATAVTAKDSFAKAQIAQKKYFIDVKKLAASKSLRAAARKEIGAEATAALKKTQINKRSLLQKLKDGKKLTNAQLKQIENNLAREARGYKIKDKKILLSLQATMQKMRIVNASTSKKMQRDFATVGMKMAAGVQAGVVQSKAALAGLATFTAKAAGFMAAALGAISWITLIASIGALAIAFFRNKDEAEEVGNKYDFLAEKSATLREETDKFIAVQNVLNDTFERGNKVLEAFGNRIGNVSSKTLTEAFKTSNLQAVSQSYIDDVVSAQKRVKELEEQEASLRDKVVGGGRISDADLATMGNLEAPQLSGSRMDYDRIISELNALRPKANQTFGEYVKGQTTVTAATKGAVDILMREREELKKLKNERFRNNKAVLEFEEGLDAMYEGQVTNIDAMLKQRDAVRTLAQQVTELTRLQSENANTNAQLKTKMLPLTETDAYIDALSRELFLIEATADANEGKTESEIARVAAIKEASEFFESVAIRETAVKTAGLAIDAAEAELLAGKTKLLQDEIKKKVVIAKNQVKIFDHEQKILHAQKLLAESRAEEDRLLNSKVGYERQRGEDMRQTNDARERSIALDQANLTVLQAQTAELQRQLNGIHQIRDAAAQAFESGVESGLAKFIKAEQQFADAFRDMVKGVLDSIADTLAKQLTTGLMKKLTGTKDPAEKMQDAIENGFSSERKELKTDLAESFQSGGNIVANKIRAALGTGVGGITPPASGGGITIDPNSGLPTNDPSKGPGIHGAAAGPSLLTTAKRYTIGSMTANKSEQLNMNPSGQVDEFAKKLDGGVFSPFINDFKGIFEENTVGGFLGQMGKTFTSLLGGFGNIFSDLIGTIGTGGEAGSGLFGLISGLFAPARYGMKPMGYATGGIARGPQAGYPAMLHGTEAVVPLPSGGKIPVDMKGGGNPTTNNVGVTVNMSGDQGTSNVSGDPGQGEQLGRVISSAVQEELQRQRRPGGILSPYGAAGGI
tara:strand:+ start:400 stop:4257 length:3858 start_codon:yes stop_codon:yes gene_type:complete